MISSTIGLPQIVALIVLFQRGAEELYSARNTRALIAAGAREAGRSYYPVVATTHLAWIASLFFLIPASATASYIVGGGLHRSTGCPLLGHRNARPILDAPHIYARQARRSSDADPINLLRHPNYAVTIAETFLLPMVFGALALGVIMGAVWTAVLALQDRTRGRSTFGRRALSEAKS